MLGIRAFSVCIIGLGLGFELGFGHNSGVGLCGGLGGCRRIASVFHPVGVAGAIVWKPSIRTDTLIMSLFGYIVGHK